MLHDILLSLIGLTGDVIVEMNDTFKVIANFDLLSQGEIKIIDRIVPLGWFYSRLLHFVERKAIRWGSSGDREGFQLYLAAFGSGLEDFLHEYVADVAALEHQILKEGPIPLSFIVHALQKYTVCMPSLHALCVTVSSQGYRGGQIIDFLSAYNSGIPLLQRVIERIYRRVQTVFLKQCMAWMLLGELHDPGLEFLVVRREDPHVTRRFIRNDVDEQISTSPGGSSLDNFGGIYDSVMRRFVMLGTTGKGNIIGDGGTDAFSSSGHPFTHQSFGASTREDAFDWNTAFMLNFERLPEAVVTPSLASKILFSGKASKLLRMTALPSSDGSRPGGAFGWSPGEAAQVYTYLCGKGGTHKGVAMVSGANGGSHGDNDDGGAAYESIGANSPTWKTELSDARLTVMFEEAMARPSLTPGAFEKVVNAANESINAALWRYMKNEFAFVDYLHLIRNTYLMGCGELFKLISDSVVHAMLKPHARPPIPRAASAYLNLTVLKESSKSLDLDEQMVLRVLQLGVNTSNINISDFSARDVTIVGAASITEVSENDTTGVSGSSRMSNSSQSTCVSLCGTGRENVASLFASVWTDKLLRHGSKKTGPSIDVHMDDTSRAFSLSQGGRLTKDTSASVPYSPAVRHVPGVPGGRMDSPPSLLSSPASSIASSTLLGTVASKRASPTYSVGAMALPAAKLVSKGFTLEAGFKCNLMDMLTWLQESSQWWPLMMPGANSEGLLVGGVSLVLHTDRAGAKLLGSGPLSNGVAGGLTVGVAFYARLEHDPLPDAYADDEGGEREQGYGDGKVDTALALYSKIYVARDGAFAEPITSTTKRLGAVVAYGEEMRLSVEYARELAEDVGATYPSSSSSFSLQGTRAGIVNRLRVSVKSGQDIPLVDDDPSADPMLSRGKRWDLDVQLDLHDCVKMQGGGEAYVALAAGGMVMDGAGGGANSFDHGAMNPSVAGLARRVLDTHVHRLEFSGRGGSLSSVAAVSAYTMARDSRLTQALEQRFALGRAWVNMTLSVALPPVLHMILQGDALQGYQRIFGLAMKMRLASDLLDKCVARLEGGVRSSAAGGLGFSMRFFVSHFLYYLQVDVFDANFNCMIDFVQNEADDFARVMRAHRNFLARVAQATFLDDVATNDCLERVLMVVLRFAGVVVLQGSTGTGQFSQSSMDAETRHIERDFFKEVGLLFTLLRKTEAKALVMKLDFNYFFSNKIASL